MRSANLQSFLRFWAQRWPERIAVWSDGASISWGELDRRSDELAAGLHKRGVVKGDAVGILMNNRLEFAQVMFAVFKVGARLTLLNVRYTPREMIYPVKDSGMRVVVTESSFLSALSAAREQADLLVFTADKTAGELSLDDLREIGAAAPAVVVDSEDIAFICYTSGTTGVPKGALLSHRCIFYASVSKVLTMGQSHQDRCLLPLPLAYTGGAIGLLRDGVIAGATTFLIQSSDGADFLDLIEREKITVFSAVPVMFERMMAQPDFDTRDLSSLRHVSTGGAAPSLHLLSVWQARGVALVQGYGLTEAAGSYVTILLGEDAVRKRGSSGRVLPNAEISIRDENGVEAATGKSGEIWVRGPMTMSGYLNSPDLTAKTMADGWMRTGDVGVLDEEGYLSVVDRVKDMLISGGLNVYPAEVESALAGVPGLQEFVIIGVPDARWGEAPMLVTPDLSGVDLPAFRKTCELELADYKRPKYLVAHKEALPRTLSGKVQKNLLRDKYKEIPADAVALKSL